MSFAAGLPGGTLGISSPSSILYARLVLSASSNIANPNRRGLSAPSVALLHSFSFPNDYMLATHTKRLKGIIPDIFSPSNHPLNHRECHRRIWSVADLQR